MTTEEQIKELARMVKELADLVSTLAIWGDERDHLRFERAQERVDELYVEIGELFDV